jgi:hypothetical protein
MPIEAVCPNGHQIKCPDSAAGKAARCPKCQSPFRIPGGTENEPASTATAENAPAPTKPAGESIVFLCPQGHRLNGPAKLAGRAGQCPHCGEKFQIPSLEEIRAAQLGTSDSNTANDIQTVEFADSGINGAGSGTGSKVDQSILEVEDIAAPHTDAIELDSIAAAVRAVEERQAHQRAASGILGTAIGSQIHTATPVTNVSMKPEAHALADLMNRLWSEREHGGVIELHLAGGNVLLPDWFDKKLSTKGYGLFAAQAADSTVTMTIVPWETVERVVIRGVVGIPDGLFE